MYISLIYWLHCCPGLCGRIQPPNSLNPQCNTKIIVKTIEVMCCVFDKKKKKLSSQHQQHNQDWVAQPSIKIKCQLKLN